MLGAIFNDNAAKLLPDFLRQYKPGFPLGHSTSNDVYSYLQLSFMRINYVPMMAFVDATSTLRSQFTGTDPIFKNDQAANIKKVINPLLVELAASRKKVTPMKKPG